VPLCPIIVAWVSHVRVCVPFHSTRYSHPSLCGGSLLSGCRVTPVRLACSICSYSHLRSLFALFPTWIPSVISVLPVPRCAACICASCSAVHHSAVHPSLCPVNHYSLTPAGCPSSAPSRYSYSFCSITDDSSGYMRFASAHVIHRPPFECVTCAHHTIPTSASRRAYLHGRACAHHLTWAACSHIRGPRRTSCFRSSRHFISSRPSPTGAPVRMPRRFIVRRRWRYHASTKGLH